ncbi:MAG TPA: imidazole glycerol phosphate synthase subunit HisH [bacterium]|nr:imidazole glycerol phosphate synthase subunit HisH [bacterium]
MIAVIDCGIGNLRSVQKAIEKAGGSARITESPAFIRSAEAIVFPGVGAFDQGMIGLKKRGLDRLLKDEIHRKPFLGICLGMQLLFYRSEEGKEKGLNVFPGEVKRFPRIKGLKVPHMGWNEVRFLGKNKLFEGIEKDYFYFVHSYYCMPEESSLWAGETEYGVRFCPALSCGKTWAVQFHPEKSAEKGLKVMRNFLKLI